MIRLHHPSSLVRDANALLTAEQSHYLARVMRVQLGDQLALFNQEDGEYLAEVTEVQKKSVQLRVVSLLREPEEETDLWLCFAPVKHQALNNIIQKATELGVSKLQPILTERTIVRKINTERAQAIAIEAAEQCERLSVPEIAPVVTLSQLLKNWDASRAALLCHESGEGEPVLEILNKVTHKCFAVFIGPEGGFSSKEFADFAAMGALPMGLGPRILRADTAAIVSLAMVQQKLGDGNKMPAFKGEEYGASN